MRERTDVVEAVRSSADLREVVSEYIPLKKSGSRFRALCPFHSEKTPSFYVDADKQLFYCFGCGVGGDVFKFLMLYEKLEFPEALRMLAARCGIEVPVAGAPANSDRQKVLGVNRRAHAFFREQLKRPAGAVAREYLEKRGLTAGAIERFGLGYAVDGWTSLKSHLAGAIGGPPRDVEALGVLAGLLARKEDSGRTYDRFRDRVIFPIADLAGDVVGFGGRILGEGEPKYLNSPETPAFSKGENLYGLPFAREAIRSEGYAVLVEGYMDVIALHQAGVTQAVGTLGTGFTAGHVRLLKRYTDRVVVNFDPDAAGRAAARRSLDVLLENGFEVQVVALPAGQDPDLYVRSEGVEAYRGRLRTAPAYIEYLTREVASRVDLATSKGKVEALNEVLPFLARIDNPVRRAGHVEMLASVFRIEDRLVLQALGDAVRSRRRDLGPQSPEVAGAGSPVSGSEARLVRLLLDSGDVRAGLLREIEEDDLGPTSRIAEIIRCVDRLVEKGDEVTYPRVGAAVSDAAREILTRIAAAPQPPPTLEEGRGCLRALRAERLRRQMGDIQKRLESAGSSSDIDELLRRKVALKRSIEALNGTSA